MVIKRLLPHLARQPGYAEMFLDEAQLTARMTHANIPQIYDFGRNAGYLFIAMELVDGIDALAMLCECAHLKRRLVPDLGVYIARQVLDALDFAHNQVDERGNPLNVIHRDISPSNVLLSTSGEVKLADFGIAWATRRSHHTKTGVLKGKYGYLSPEQILFDDVDARSDLFSVGILLAELLTGRRLFSAPRELDVLLMVRDVNLERLDAARERIDPALDRILRKALRQHPDERFATAADFRDALDAWMRDHGSEMDASKIAAVVDSLYRRVWERKRGGVPESLSNMQPRVGRTDAPEQPVSIDGGGRAPRHDDATSGPAEYRPDDQGAGGGGQVVEAAGAQDEVSSGIIALPDADVQETAVTQSEWAEISQPSVSAGPAAAPIDEGATAASSNARGDARGASRPPEQEDATAGAPSTVRPPEPGQRARFAGGAHRRARPTPDQTGDFATTSPIRVLHDIAHKRATGLLTVSIGAIYKEIFIRYGSPRYVSSNVFSERFGEYLVQEGVLFPGELSMALAMMPRHENRLSETLVSLNLLSPLDVLRHLTLQVRKKIVDVCTWTKGRYAWFEGRESPREAFPLELNMFEILGIGALALSDDAIATWGRASAQLQPRLVNAGRTAPQIFQLGALLREVCRALDGTRTVNELQVKFSQQREHGRLVRMLYLLLETGLATAEPV